MLFYFVVEFRIFYDDLNHEIKTIEVEAEDLYDASVEARRILDEQLEKKVRGLGSAIYKTEKWSIWEEVNEIEEGY